jgi:putative ABC transport system ATP-binding protein
MENSSCLALSGLTFGYQGQAPLIEGMTYEFQSGKFYLIQGPSGIGKSTLLRLFIRLEEPSGGEIRFNGIPLSDHQPPILRRSILYIQQRPTVIDGSVKENLILPFQFHHNQSLEQPDDKRLRALLHDFRLGDLSLEDHAQTLSLGQQQRLCFIRALLLSPSIFLLDEPASSLDEESALIVEQTTWNLCCDLGLTVIMVSHRKMNFGGTETVALRMEKGKLIRNP